VLGWLGSVFIGSAYQLGPVIAGNSLRGALIVPLDAEQGRAVHA